ncbi:hypothetical protein GH714_030766 [Hevea brasiliensis]|uniref:Uncharacterized protein n=1 Tax=Hevea brasiliensis TaxID=3981 RepID=A0A6A6NBJ4_HEVBR|nr:hypothetical protein GH714_030766 [Hevea brasiliensis]
MRPLTINGDTFHPHDVVQDVIEAFKKNFHGSWPCWCKVPTHSRDQWFNHFERNYSIKDEHKDMIWDTFKCGEWKRETTNQVLREDELYLKIHRIKDDKWICGKSERVWNTFTRNIKQKVSETSTARNEDGSEVRERDVGLNRATEENEAQECNEDNNILTSLQNILKEQVLNTWIDTIGGAKKGRVYGLGSKTSVLGELTHICSVHSNAPTSPTVPPQQVIETPEFELAVNHVVDQRVDD